MFSRTASTPASGMTAQIGAPGGALSGWPAILWLVRVLFSSEFSAMQGQAWAALVAMLGRIVSGDFQLRGCEVTKWSVCRGLERTDYVRFRVHGVLRDGSQAGGFTLTLQNVVEDAVEWLARDVILPVALVRIGCAGVLGGFGEKDGFGFAG